MKHANRYIVVLQIALFLEEYAAWDEDGDASRFMRPRESVCN